MEKVSLNNVQLDHLARRHPSLGPHFNDTAFTVQCLVIVCPTHQKSVAPSVTS